MLSRSPLGVEGNLRENGRVLWTRQRAARTGTWWLVLVV
jgi:hypothetical protein